MHSTVLRCKGDDMVAAEATVHVEAIEREAVLERLCNVQPQYVRRKVLGHANNLADSGRATLV